MERITRILDTLGPFGCEHLDLTLESPELKEIYDLFDVGSMVQYQLKVKSLDNVKLKLYRRNDKEFLLEVIRQGEGILGIY